MKRIIGIVAIITLMSSCKIFYPDQIFKIDRDKMAMADTIKTANEYVIQPGDQLSVGVFSNNGYELVDVLTHDNNGFAPLQFLVKESGYVGLPMLDSVYLTGMTITEAERILEKKYSYYFVNPFIRIQVSNRNVYVFKGRQGAVVVTLDRENMNLLQVLGKAGGIPPGGKAYDIRVVRGNIKNPTVFNVDLSTIDGMMKANLTMEANDIVYIQSRLTSSDVLAQISPVLTILSTVIFLTTAYFTITKL